MDDLRLVCKNALSDRTEFSVGNVRAGRDFLIMAGPCSVESEEQILETARCVKNSGANILRGGAYKPRTSPYSFQGLGLKGLQMLKKAGDLHGLPIVTEVIDTRDVFLVSEYADLLQIGARNMQNFALLKEVGKAGTPVLLKRGMNSSLADWLNCAEYILKEGNSKVILCERGLKTVEDYTRNTLDLSIVSAVKDLSHLPIIADPSHATGRRELIERMSLSAIMAGCDGLMVEVHPHPEVALSDGRQSLTPEMFDGMMQKVRRLLEFRETLWRPPAPG